MAKAIDLTINAEERTEFGKGAARRVRRANKIPAVLHDHGHDPVHLSLPGHQIMLALKASSNSLFTVKVGSTTTLALPRQIQRDPIRGLVEHLDLDVVRRGEMVTVAVPVHLVGEAAPETVVVHELNDIELSADATLIPERVEFSLSGLTAGTVITAGDLSLPDGSTLITDADAQVFAVTAQQSAESAEAELAAAEAEAGVVVTEAPKPSGEVESEGGSHEQAASASAAAVQQS